MPDALPDLRTLTFDRSDLGRVVLACIKRNPGLTSSEIANQIIDRLGLAECRLGKLAGPEPRRVS